LREKKDANLRPGTIVDSRKLVFVCDASGSTGFWQHPISGTRTRSGGDLAQRFLAEDRERVRAAVKGACEMGQASFVATLQAGPDAGKLVELQMERIQLGDQQQLLGFTRVQPNEGQLRTPKALRESELRLRLISQVATDVMWDLNLVTGESWHSEGASAAFGYPKDDTLGVADWWLETVHPDDRRRVEASLQVYLEKGEGLWLEQYRMRRPDGSYEDIEAEVTLDCSGLATFLGNQRVTGPKYVGNYDKQIAFFSHATGATRDSGSSGRRR